MFIVLETLRIIRLSLSGIIKILSYFQVKKTAVSIMSKKDHNKIINNMISDGKQQRKYKETDDNILKVLKSSQSFLYQHFKNLPHFRQLLPSSH